MKTFAVQFLMSSPRLNEIHLLLFHGKIIDDERHYRDTPVFGGGPIKSLFLIHNGRQIPDVFQPVGSPFLIVSEKVKESLGGFSYITFQSVHFNKLVDFPVYPPGDFAFPKDKEFRKLVRTIGDEHFLEQLPDVPALHDKVGRYYELVPTRLSDVSSRYRSARPIVYKLPGAPIWKEELLLSADLVRDFPIVWWTYTVFNEEAFARISPYLDRDYFGIAEIDL
ncbi:MAG: hypothetical protein K8T89_12965 [Planctomycetes bacterium]|nr:hypothetical protein [Planctomycetota bacterium]